MKPRVSFSFPVPLSPKGKRLVWSTNQDRSMHWGTRKRYVDAWHEATRWAWRALPESHRHWEWPATVLVRIPFTQKRRRDPMNYVGTVVKALVDALVLEGVWPDDTADWVTVAQPLLVEGDEVTVTLEAR